MFYKFSLIGLIILFASCEKNITPVADLPKTNLTISGLKGPISTEKSVFYTLKKDSASRKTIKTKEKELFTKYNTNGFKLETLYTTSDTVKTTYFTYDANFRNTSEHSITYLPSDNRYFRALKLFEYDSLGYQKVLQEYDFTDSIITIKKTISTYNKKGLTTEKTVFLFTEGSWNPIKRIEMEYDQYSNILKEKFQRKYMFLWISDSIKTHTYENQKLKLTEIEHNNTSDYKYIQYEYNQREITSFLLNKNKQIDKKIVKTLNGNQKLSKIADYNPMNEENSSIFFTYMPDDKILIKTIQHNKKEVSKTFFQYDRNGNKTAEKSYTNGKLFSSTETVYTFHKN